MLQRFLRQVLTETDAALTTSGTLTSTDVDNADNAFTADTVVGTIGTFTMQLVPGTSRPIVPLTASMLETMSTRLLMSQVLTGHQALLL